MNAVQIEGAWEGNTMTKSAEEKRWRAEADANALIEAAAINADKARLKLALDASRKIETEARERAEAARKVAKRKPQSPKKKVR